MTFTVISDTHYYSKLSGISGSTYDRAQAKSQMLLRGCAEMLTAAFNQLAADSESDIVLISGDLTSNGEKWSHEEFRELLRKLKSAGKRVYVITATHDFRECGVTDGYCGDEIVKVPTLTRAELYDFYREFGPNEAIAVHQPSMSYIAQLPDSCRLFALNDDTNLAGCSGFSEECFGWIEAQLKEAAADGQTVIVMTHHPMTAPHPLYELMGKSNMSAGSLQRLDSLAEMGAGFVLTGHSHMHDISYHLTPGGKCIYAVSTGAVCGYPGAMRKITIDKSANALIIKSFYLTEPTGIGMGGLSVNEYLKNQLVGTIAEMIDAAAADVRTLADKATAVSIDPKIIYKTGFIIKPFARLIKKLSLGSFARQSKAESGLSKAQCAELDEVKLIDFIMTAALYAFSGDAPYSPDTPEYKASMGFLKIVDSFFAALHLNPVKKLTGKTACDFVSPMLYTSGIPDCDAVLPLFPTEEQLTKLSKGAKNDTVKESKKGMPLLAATVLLLPLILALLPAAALVFLVLFIINFIKYRKEITQ